MGIMEGRSAINKQAAFTKPKGSVIHEVLAGESYDPCMGWMNQPGSRCTVECLHASLQEATVSRIWI
jgi:hypothetical protein